MNITKNNKYPWEVDEIDLNLRHYSGDRIDVMKKIKYDIEKYLSNPLISQPTRQIYSAIYNAIIYYTNISSMPDPEDYLTQDTFLSNSIKSFNKDYNYLSTKYDSPDIITPSVISTNCRIKSPLSFMEKVREKVTEYIQSDRDFQYFNESLRDLIGFRIIVNPSQEIKQQGLEAQSNFLYKVFYDLMSYHGINNQEYLRKGDYKFIPVNTRYSPNKLEKLKARPSNQGFSDDINSGKYKIYCPKQRPAEIELPCVDSVLKDFNMWPKFTGYQSLHTCVIPPYSDNVEETQNYDIPSYIIPSKSNDYAIEYQIRLQNQDKYAEYGGASHKKNYKPGENDYHRLAVPFFIDFDNPKYPNEESNERKKFLKLRNFAESYEKFYGHSFEEKFNISYKELKNRFSIEDINDVLADKKHVCYNKEKDLYYLEDIPNTIYINEEEVSHIQETIRNGTPAEFTKLLEDYKMTASIIPTDSRKKPLSTLIEVSSFKEINDQLSIVAKAVESLDNQTTNKKYPIERFKKNNPYGESR